MNTSKYQNLFFLIIRKRLDIDFHGFFPGGLGSFFVADRREEAALQVRVARGDDGEVEQHFFLCAFFAMLDHLGGDFLAVRVALVHGFDGQAQGQVRVHCARLTADTIALSVSDDGLGMDESVRRRIFDPFFTTKLGTGGSGLGMHIVHNIVTNILGGQIEVRSTPGGGTQMLMQLPSMAPTRSVREGEGEADGTPGQSRAIASGSPAGSE